jgi:hypothetical protein
VPIPPNRRLWVKEKVSIGLPASRACTRWSTGHPCHRRAWRHLRSRTRKSRPRHG